MEATIDLEAIATVPVAPLLDKLVRFRKVGGDELVIAKEEADADEREDDVYSGTQTGGLFEGELLCFYRFFLYMNKTWWAGAFFRKCEKLAPTFSPILVR